MERMGYDVAYATDVDVHANPALLLSHKGIVSTGHDEYWSKEMFDGWEAARDSGRSLGVYGANNAYWQVRFELSSSGVANRTMVCYKLAALDPVKGATTTDQFRLVGRSEQRLIGVQYSALQTSLYPFVVQNSLSWVYAGTGFKDGDSIPNLVGWESDRLFSEYPAATSVSQTLLSRSPVVSQGYNDVAQASVYQAPSGAWVFAASTFQWSWLLSDVPFHGTSTDSRIQRTTQNVLDRFVQSTPLALSAPAVTAPPGDQTGLEG